MYTMLFLGTCWNEGVSEGVGFEPTRRAMRLTVFKTAAFDHSATPPIFNYSRIYHLIKELPQVSPPPKAVSRTRFPLFIVPSLTASSRAMGIVADDIFPYFSMVT